MAIAALPASGVSGWRWGAQVRRRLPKDGQSYLRHEYDCFAACQHASSSPCGIAASGQALIGPEEAGEGDEDGGRDDDPATILFFVLDPEGSGDGKGDDSELA